MLKDLYVGKKHQRPLFYKFNGFRFCVGFICTLLEYNENFKYLYNLIRSKVKHFLKVKCAMGMSNDLKTFLKSFLIYSFMIFAFFIVDAKF